MRGHLLPSLVQVGSRRDVSGQPGGVELVLLTCPRVLAGVEVGEWKEQLFQTCLPQNPA